MQDDDKEQQHGYNTRSRTTSIIQEAMLACIDITKPTYIVSQDLDLLNYREKTFKHGTKDGESTIPDDLAM